MDANPRLGLIEALKACVEWLRDNPPAVKTFEFYARTLTNSVRSYYNGYMEYTDFVSILDNLIIGQLRRAWFEGMAENGLTEADMTNEWATDLRGIIMAEQAYVPDFALAIERAKRDGSKLDPLLNRAQLWANRYNEVVNQARLATAAVGQKQIWVLGPTEAHCHTGDNGRPGIGCADLAGKVAFAAEWSLSGILPQSDRINCGGWQCKCELKETNKNRTKNIKEILGI